MYSFREKVNKPERVKKITFKRKMSNKKQLEKLVEIMKKNPEIAKGISQ